ncbi:cellobiohydrolaseI [Sanghuangporus baumii]|uniref:Glucanase n=1 Tax=Sanghuangporus baumii TaxID=108892 RepID=A0A9Q5HY37_SANBA|nr:cellobiohydrolaseI [Sanghuangporus baumii]
MLRRSVLLAFTLCAVVRGQQVGTVTAESHPALSVQECTSSGSCTTQQKSIVLDSNWRWLHDVDGYTNCYTGNTWDTSLCPDPTTCATNCALEGADYSGTYGITTSGDALTLKFVTQSQQKNIGSRVYLLDDDSTYKVFNLKNQEFTFDVDMSQLPCGINGALYFVEMDADGGLSRFSTNLAGAKYGTGYCDTQCPHDIKFINGEANVLDWTPSDTDSNAGTGRYGACCIEMDVWEANSMAAAYTPHTCSVSGQVRCEDAVECGDSPDHRYEGICDKDGCDFNSFRMGDKSFLGPGLTVDTSQTITVVTQFLTADNTTSGQLSEIRRLYVQNGQVIQNSKTNIAGLDPYDSITDQFCTDQKEVFGDTNSFSSLGGLQVMGESLDRGVVLVMSIWDDHTANMLWLDSNYPTDADPSQPGVARGNCSTSSGVPEDVESQSPNSQVVFSNIKYGPIGSTF